MKRYAMLVVFLLALCIGFGFSAALQAAEITHLEGKVQVQIAPSQAWQTAEIGMGIKIGDSIKTARRSKADIALDDQKKNFIRIEPNTLVVINSTSPGEINRFDLAQGKLYANIENIRSGLPFEVGTPSAVAGVRGTGWSVGAERDRDEVAVYEREVYLKAYDQNKNLISETTIPEGFKTSLERFEQPGALAELTALERQRWTETKTDIMQRMDEKGKGQDKGKQITEAAQTVETVQQVTTDAIADTKEALEEKVSEENIDKFREGGHY